MSSDKKSEQLGMPFGTANARLRKNILFNLLARYGENICYQCGEMILSVDQLSIEHKVAWLDNDIALFWDLSNIAFSHLKCNISAANKSWMTPEFHNKRHKFISKPVNIGEKWCYHCQKSVDIALFTKNKHKIDGVASECSNCRKLQRYKLKE